MGEKRQEFFELCENIARKIDGKYELSRDIELDGKTLSYAQLQKNAIMGYAYAKEYFRQLIANELSELVEEKHTNDTATASYAKNLSQICPSWYENICSAIFEEGFGLAGLAEWFKDEYKDSSSAKVIGSRIYFMRNGQMHLMPQSLSERRREQLIRNLLLLSDGERLDKNYHELYLLDGTRVTIYRRELTKQRQEAIVFRRYIIPEYSFLEQARRHTMPTEAIPLFESMVKLGVNVAFCGAVKTSKTTFLSTWQSYEDESLEGVLIETDPEIPVHRLIPNAPIMQLLADGEDLRSIIKSLLRSDADYFIFAEARDGIALDAAVRLARKGSRRMKMTFHTKSPELFTRDVAVEIVHEMGGNLEEITKIVASSFDYVFHFVQLKNKNIKKLNAIYEIGVDEKTNTPYSLPLMKFNGKNWKFYNQISKAKSEIYELEDKDEFVKFKELLETLSEQATERIKTNEG